MDNDMTNDKSQNFSMKVRKIRKNTGAKIEDIILAAFSASVHKYHLHVSTYV